MAVKKVMLWSLETYTWDAKRWTIKKYDDRNNERSLKKAGCCPT